MLIVASFFRCELSRSVYGTVDYTFSSHHETSGRPYPSDMGRRAPARASKGGWRERSHRARTHQVRGGASGSASMTASARPPGKRPSEAATVAPARHHGRRTRTAPGQDGQPTGTDVQPTAPPTLLAPPGNHAFLIGPVDTSSRRHAARAQGPPTTEDMDAGRRVS